jgi:hypothetical protein
LIERWNWVQKAGARGEKEISLLALLRVRIRNPGCPCTLYYLRRTAGVSL